MRVAALFVPLLLCWTAAAESQDAQRLQLMDVFDLEVASDPQLSPDGALVAYVRGSADRMKDTSRKAIWTVAVDGTDHRPLVDDARSPRWSPDGARLAYLAAAEGRTQIHVRWMDSGQTTAVTDVLEGPSGISWSPDGEQIAFTMFVPSPAEPLAPMPPKPEGAEWAEPFQVIDAVRYRGDGSGYHRNGATHVFVVPAVGGTARQLTSGPHDHRAPLSWTPDARSIVLSANLRDDADLDPRDTELYRLDVADSSMTQLTHRAGPDDAPAVSPDGSMVAYTGFDDSRQGFQVTRLYVAPLDGGTPKELLADLDRSVRSPRWRDDGKGVYFLYVDHGVTTLGYVSVSGSRRVMARHVGGTYLGRPYGGGSFSTARRGLFATTVTGPHRPADVAVGSPRGTVRPVTALNEDLLGQRQLGEVEELTFPSSFDDRPIQAWVVRPPQFDASATYPMILEIHGGPFAAYGPRFSTEMQLFAAAGYVVLYVNPRGSTSYGEAFANLIHHDYPGHDHDDLMSAVDALLAQGYVDPDRLYITGGSGGGVLSTWMVGKTDRFAAAAAVKPFVNWLSFALTTDFYPEVARYWLPGQAWEHAEHCWAHSPLALVGDVVTPTLLITGEDDYRTPISETEQYYQALKLQGVDAAMVRVPGASHGITARPSHQIAKVSHVLAWFERYGGDAEGTP